MRGKRWGTTARRIVPGVLALAFLWFAGAAHLPRLAAAPDEPALVTLSIVGTSDLHGAAFLGNRGPGGLPLLSGYVNNLRASRASDGGAVLLIDSGDTFQGDVESNLSEGALIVDAYNAMGYTAEAIGTTISISDRSTRRTRDSCRAMAGLFFRHWRLVTNSCQVLRALPLNVCHAFRRLCVCHRLPPLLLRSWVGVVV